MGQSTVTSYETEVDRMINEGLGGGFIIHDYDMDRFEVKALEPRIIRLEEQDNGQIEPVGDGRKFA